MDYIDYVAKDREITRKEAIKYVMRERNLIYGFGGDEVRNQVVKFMREKKKEYAIIKRRKKKKYSISDFL